MNLIKKLPQKSALLCVFLCAGLFLFSCGIEEYYFLPQISQGSIQRISNTEATINIPSIEQYYYASNYSIFYRIYISSEDISSEIQTSSEVLNSISPDLSRDFTAIFPSSDPTNTSSITSVNSLFKNRNYFELDLDGVDIKTVLTTAGGTLRIRFPAAPWGIPTASFDSGGDISIRRSRELISPEPRNNSFFQNTAELSDYAKATANINADVAARSGVTSFAYVSMYIVAAGLDPALFTPIYSKPTHISIFKLPNTN
jgi:hypothetical protein